MGDQRRVVVTGAAGRIGQVVCAALADRWDLVPVDIRPAPTASAVLDVTDGAACREAFAGADAVVHLAADPNPEAAWDSLLPANIEAPYQVATAAVACGVRRLVLASSLHAVSGYPDGRQRRATDQPRPLNLYGATKAWAEALGATIAATSSTTVVALRIGYFAEDRPPGSRAVAGRAVGLAELAGRRRPGPRSRGVDRRGRLGRGQRHLREPLSDRRPHRGAGARIPAAGRCVGAGAGSRRPLISSQPISATSPTKVNWATTVA